MIGSNNLILTDSDGNNVTADLTSLLDDTNTTNASLSLATNTLTLTDSASNSVDVDFSSLDNSGLTLADVTANGATSALNVPVIIQDTLTAKNLLIENGSEKSFQILTDDYNYKLGDIDGGEEQSFLEVDSLSGFTKIHNSSLGIKKTPSVTLDINGTDAVQLTSGTELQRPLIPANGMIRYNSDANVFEGYAGGAWGEVPKFSSDGTIFNSDGTNSFLRLSQAAGAFFWVRNI